jgi:hypothetical protein
MADDRLRTITGGAQQPSLVMSIPRYHAAAAAIAAALTLPGCGGSADDARSLPQLATAVPASLIGSCDDLGARLAAPNNTTITAVTHQPAGSIATPGPAVDVPAHCIVTGYMFERTSPVDGHRYAIGFEVRLPQDWNGRFYHQGNGALDGAVVPASGASPTGVPSSALGKGFAVLSSNAGHDGTRGAAFGIDPQARLDYGYQAVAKLTPMAQELIEAAYGKAPDRSYFGGCSNGGRHAMVAAARYADQYDGILAEAPGYRLPLAALANIAGAQRYATVATDPADLASAFTTEERRLLADAILEQCDALDGLADGIVHDTAACQARFDIATHVPTCDAERDGTCLTAAQKSVLADIFAGPRTQSGALIYLSFPFDPGIAGGNVAFWEFAAPFALDSGAVAMVFQVPPADPATFDGPQFALSADLDLLLHRLDATDDIYTESSLSAIAMPDPSDLATLRDRGGKMIVIHGVSDMIFSVDDTRAWYEGLDAANAGRAAGFARFFPVPGMTHCRGGPATDRFDALEALVAWVEHGDAPDRIVASARGPSMPGQVNADVPGDWSPQRTRPLCPYPAVARYRGSGDPESAESFVCDQSPGR